VSRVYSELRPRCRRRESRTSYEVPIIFVGFQTFCNAQTVTNFVKLCSAVPFVICGQTDGHADMIRCECADIIVQVKKVDSDYSGRRV
jgi:hypothetical protein